MTDVQEPYSHVKKEKCILHMDGDAFFVACEVAKDPRLKGRPVVTGEERGIASALSYEAKALGLTRGYPIYRIQKEFPQVIILPGDYKSYAEYSEKMFNIVRRYTDDVEEYSIDECFADLTGLDKPHYMTYAEIAAHIKKEVMCELGLSISVGLGPSKVLAKVGSKWHKPNGLTVMTRDTSRIFLDKVSIENVWGIGPRTAHLLKFHGVETALDFARKDLPWVQEHFSKPYEVIWQELNGTSILSVDPNPKTEYSSIQRTRTFHPPTNDMLFLLSQFSKNIEEACLKARHFCLVPQSISFFLKTQSFRYYAYSVPLPVPTHAPEAIVEIVRKYFRKIYRHRDVYRTTGITLHDLAPVEVTQLDLFGGSEMTHKFEKVHEAIDRLHEKMGKRVVHLASTNQAIKRKVKGTDRDDMDRNLLFL